MGLFQKIKATEKSSDELPKYVDTLLESSHQSTNDEIDERFSVQSMSLNQKYGIDHAVALMRDLPNENFNVIVSVVTKTLESANIDVACIIEDAKVKEMTLYSQIKQLNEEINALEAQIADKKEQIKVSSAILEETCKVREMLEQSELRDTNPKASTKSSQQSRGNEEPARIDPATKLAVEAI